MQSADYWLLEFIRLCILRSPELLGGWCTESWGWRYFVRRGSTLIRCGPLYWLRGGWSHYSCKDKVVRLRAGWSKIKRHNRRFRGEAMATLGFIEYKDANAEVRA